VISNRKTRISTATAPTAVPGAFLLLAAVLPPVGQAPREPSDPVWNVREQIVECRPILDLQESEPAQKMVTNLPFPGEFAPGEARESWVFLGKDLRENLCLAQPGAWNSCSLVLSGALESDAAEWEDYHRRVLDLPEGMAWHFFLSRDGKVTVSDRWLQQGDAPGELGYKARQIIVCLDGREGDAPPTLAQWQAVDELLDFMEGRTGSLNLVAARAETVGFSQAAAQGLAERRRGDVVKP
jgi:hypothetical protein